MREEQAQDEHLAHLRQCVKQGYFWYGMTPDITEYVQGCPACSINKTPNRYGRSPMTRYHAGSPMERVHLDFLGPLPNTTRGNQHDGGSIHQMGTITNGGRNGPGGSQ